MTELIKSDNTQVILNLQAQLAEAELTIQLMREALLECDEAMAWYLGGEPLPSLMLKAREVIKAVLAITKPSLYQKKSR